MGVMVGGCPGQKGRRCAVAESPSRRSSKCLAKTCTPAFT